MSTQTKRSLHVLMGLVAHQAHRQAEDDAEYAVHERTADAVMTDIEESTGNIFLTQRSQIRTALAEIEHGGLDYDHAEWCREDGSDEDTVRQIVIDLLKEELDDGV